MSDEELKAELERLRSENAALKKVGSSPVRMKVSEKGALSIYGMGRFPVTLYKEQWLKLLGMADEISRLHRGERGAVEDKSLTDGAASPGEPGAAEDRAPCCSTLLRDAFPAA